jgi:sulfur carrier protein ThiS
MPTLTVDGIKVEVPEGTTLGQLFAQKMPGSKPQDYLIRLNRQPAGAEEVLTEGCRVSITPTKIEGARTLRLARVGIRMVPVGARFRPP